MARASQEPAADPAHAGVRPTKPALHTREGPAWARARARVPGCSSAACCTASPGLPGPPRSGLAGGPARTGHSARLGLGRLRPVCEGVLASLLKPLRIAC